MSCVPQWASLNAECPYGRRLPLDVTLPNNPDFWQNLSVLYGYIPWVLCFGIGVLFLVYRGSRELAVGSLAGLTAAINELVKLGIKQARPIGSCLTTCGMPSSHSAVAVGLFLYLTLDAAYRVHRVNGKPLSFFPTCGSLADSAVKLAKGFMVLPFGTISPGEFSTYLAIWAPLLMPVPISRVLLSDHSPSQVMAGSFVGFLAVVIWFPFMLYLRSTLRKHVGKKVFYIFVHNYDVPESWKEVNQGTDGATADPLVAGKSDNDADV